jgi:hypothetical protein
MDFQFGIETRDLVRVLVVNQAQRLAGVVEVFAYPIERVARRNAEAEDGNESKGEDTAENIGHGS